MWPHQSCFPTAVPKLEYEELAAETASGNGRWNAVKEMEILYQNRVGTKKAAMESEVLYKYNCQPLCFVSDLPFLACTVTSHYCFLMLIHSVWTFVCVPSTEHSTKSLRFSGGKDGSTSCSIFPLANYYCKLFLCLLLTKLRSASNSTTIHELWLPNKEK